MIKQKNRLKKKKNIKRKYFLKLLIHKEIKYKEKQIN